MSNVWTFIYTVSRVAVPRALRGLWYWNTVEDRLLQHVQRTAVQGDSASVLSAMDDFNDREWMMCIERAKREKLECLLSSSSMGPGPKVCLELGTYCGYSAIVFGRALPAGSRLITVEKNAKMALIARQVIQMAGLENVMVHTADSADLITNLRSQCAVDALDFVFVDHAKNLYLRDLRLLEEQRLLREGALLVADNTLWPGAPDYLEYVEGGRGRYQTERAYFPMETFNVQDAMTISVYMGNDED